MPSSLFVIALALAFFQLACRSDGGTKADALPPVVEPKNPGEDRLECVPTSSKWQDVVENDALVARLATILAEPNSEAGQTYFKQLTNLDQRCPK